MAGVKLEIVDLNDEHHFHTLQGLLSGTGKWTTSNENQSGVLEAAFTMAEPIVIKEIDVGNFYSETIEICVGKSSEPKSTKHKTLLPTTSLFAPNDRKGQTMKFFHQNDFDEDNRFQEWDLLHIKLCKQSRKYRRGTFGLSVLKVRTDNSESTPTGISPSPVQMNIPKLNMGISEAEELPADFLLHEPTKKIHNKLKQLLEKQVKQSGNKDTFFSRAEKMLKVSERQRTERSFNQVVRRFISENSTVTDYKEMLELWYIKYPLILTKDEKSCLRNLVLHHVENDTDVGPGKKRKQSSEDTTVKNRPVSGKSRNETALMDIHGEENDGWLCKSDVDHSEVVSNFRPENLKDYSTKKLCEIGILVHEQQYLYDKDLPLKNGKKMRVTGGSTVRFIKVGSSVFVESEGKVNLPSIPVKNLPGLFKGYSKEEVFNSKPSCLPRDLLESVLPEKDVEQCPICDGLFPLLELPEHSATCGEGVGEKCPICGGTFEKQIIEEHASECAAVTYDE